MWRAAVVVLLLLLSGCGTSDDRDQAREAVQRFFSAIEGDRGEAACAELTGPARQQLESQESKPCGEAITALGLEGSGIAAAQVFITNAKVDLDSGESAFLSREAERWRISAIACKPADGKPRDRPFDCELEA